MFYARPLPEESHIHGYERLVLVVCGIRGFTNAQATFHLVREQKRSLNRRRRVGSGAKKSESRAITGIRYLGSPSPACPERRWDQPWPTHQRVQRQCFSTSKVPVDSPRHPQNVLIERRLAPQGMQETLSIVSPFSRFCSTIPPSELGPVWSPSRRGRTGSRRRPVLLNAASSATTPTL